MESLELQYKIIESTLRGILSYRFPYYERENKLTKYLIKVANKMKNCRTARMGGHEYVCSVCGDKIAVYNSCHNRSCPMCNNLPREEWLSKQKTRLLNTRYVHIVFKLPEELNELLLKNKKELIELFFKRVNKILKKIYNLKLTGIIMYYEDAGSTLTLHPHIHCLLNLGYLNEEKKKWEPIEIEKFKENELQLELRKGIIKGLKSLLRRELLKCPKKIKESELLIEIEKLNEKKFDVYIAAQHDNVGEAVIEYFSKSVRGGCISNDRIMEVTEKEVTFEYSNAQTNGETKLMTLDIDEFIKRVFLHIPIERQKLIRYYGLFSSSKKEQLKLCRELLKESEPKEEEKLENGESGIKEKRIVICPSCGSEMLKTKIILPVKLEKKKIVIPKKLIQLPLTG